MADQKANGIDILTDGKFGRSMCTWTLSGDSKVLNATLLSMVILFKDHDGGQYETRKDIGIRITELYQVKTTTT